MIVQTVSQCPSLQGPLMPFLFGEFPLLCKLLFESVSIEIIELLTIPLCG